MAEILSKGAFRNQPFQNGVNLGKIRIHLDVQAERSGALRQRHRQYPFCAFNMAEFGPQSLPAEDPT